MKGLTTLSVFAFFYLVIIILFNEAAGEPRGVEEDDKNIGQPSSPGKQPEQKVEKLVNGTNLNATKVPAANQAKFGNVATEQHPAQKGNKGSSSNEKVRAASSNANQKNDTNPLADLFQISDPTMRTTLGAIYGAYNGNDQCSRKAFCMMGNYMRDMPGRDVLFLFMGNYIPQEYSLYYAIFKAAVLYGQNCSVYVCVPDPVDSNNAATSARPSPTSPNFNAEAPPR
ncbi:hypothetical protein Ocin01_05231, partial [Orchesella cincta]